MPIASSVTDSAIQEEHNCGLFNLRPKCLQGAANIKVFVGLCCVLVALQQTLASGYINSVLTTIEKRFDVTSGLLGAIASTYEVGNLVTIIFVSYLGSRRHIPVWLGIGTIVMGIGSLIFVTPQFVTDEYTKHPIQRNETPHNICKDQTGSFATSPVQPTCTKDGPSNTLAIVIFMVAQLLIGSGGSPVFTLGTTYIDDHIEKESAALYIGCLYSMVAFGPVCGFLLGGYLLSFYVDILSFNVNDLNVKQDDPRWVGAWWAGFFIIGCLLLIVSVPVFMFPKRLRRPSDSSVVFDGSSMSTVPSENTTSSTPASSVSKPSYRSEEQEKYGSNIRDIPKSILNLFYNPVFSVTCVCSCMELVIVSGFAVFLPKYLETQFSISKSQANIFIGGIAIPGACLGILAGGFVLKKFQLRPNGAIKFIISSNVMALFMYSLLFFLSCDNVEMAGATIPYFKNYTDDFQVNLTAICNKDCGCSTSEISPVCGIDNISYFSPCYAGCSMKISKDRFYHSYHNCKCIASNLNDTFRAIDGPCPRICHTVIPFMVMLFFMSLVVSLTQMPILMIVLRTVAEHERSFALGMQFVIFRLFGYIPSPIVFGHIIDSTCLLWSSNCSNTVGFCLMYDIEKFRNYFLGICTVLKFVTALMYCIDWILIRQVEKNATSIIEPEDMVYSARSQEKGFFRRKNYDLVGDGNSSDEGFLQSSLSKESALRNRPPTPGPKLSHSRRFVDYHLDI